MMKSKFNIIGPGAIGHLWHCFFNHIGISSHLYGKVAAKARQIEVKSTSANFSTLVHYKSLQDWQESDAILVCIKAYQLEELCQQLALIVSKTCPLILMMNGMGLIEIVRRYLPQNPLIHASLTHGAYLEQNSLIHTGKGETLLGNLHSDYTQSQFADLIGTMNVALPTVSWNANHRAAMHLKLLVNAVINPVTALQNIKNGEIIQNGKLIAEAESLLMELSPLLPSILPEKSIDQLRRHIITIAQNTRLNTSSMRQDVINRRRTEIDYINGYLLTIAKKQSLPLSRHSQIIQQIKQLNTE